MPLFDILDEVAKRQVEKTDVGDNRIMGVMVGQVIKNYDEKKQGFVLVSITTRDYAENRQVWARMALPYGGKGWGDYFIPEVGDQVLVVFEQGNIERAYVIGSVPLESSAFMKGAFEENNMYKRIKSRNGNVITIEDNKEGDGAKDKITVTTATEAHTFVMDNDKKEILLSDKDGNNKILMKTESGQMEIIAAKKLTIKVGDNITMIFNGGNGTVSLEASKLKTDITGSTELKSTGNTKLEGGNVTVNGNSMLKLSSSGAVTVSGMPIKLG